MVVLTSGNLKEYIYIYNYIYIGILEHNYCWNIGICVSQMLHVWNIYLP